MVSIKFTIIGKRIVFSFLYQTITIPTRQPIKTPLILALSAKKLKN